MRDMDPQDRQAVITIGLALFFLAAVLFLITQVLKFRFVVGISD
jgi:hypothetical protein